jgi:hypothetical protein
MQMRTPKQPPKKYREPNQQDEQKHQKQERKQNIPPEVLISAGKVIGQFREILSTDSFKNRKQRTSGLAACDELEAALKK